MKGLRFSLALTLGKLSAAFCKVFFPKRGSNLPGSIALRIDPLFLTHISGIDKSKTIFITGTNGKSTSNNMVVHVFRTAGYSVCSNLEGANMKPGVATALIKHSDMGGRFKNEYLILEIDERSLEAITEDLKPGHLCVTNVQKDQVQRNGDPDYIYQKIKRAVSSVSSVPSIDGLCLYVNNEEPRSKSLGNFLNEGGRIISFGVAKNERSSPIEKDFGVTMPCPLCHDALIFSHMNLSGVGFFSCPACGFASNEQPDTQVTDVDYENETFRAESNQGNNTDYDRLTKDDVFRLSYSASFFLYNYSLCTCIASEFSIEKAVLKKAFDTFTNIGGRMESFIHAGKRVTYMRVKQENPDTLQNALDTIAGDKNEKVFIAGPDIVSDIVPFYSNTFYTYDCNFEPLINSGIEKYICFGSIVGRDMVNRLRYAGVPEEMIEILDTDDEDKILAAIASVKTDNIYLITLLKKYEQLKEKAG